jgi:hypothetical protein
MSPDGGLEILNLFNLQGSPFNVLRPQMGVSHDDHLGMVLGLRD